MYNVMWYIELALYGGVHTRPNSWAYYIIVSQFKASQYYNNIRSSQYNFYFGCLFTLLQKLYHLPKCDKYSGFSLGAKGK